MRKINSILIAVVMVGAIVGLMAAPAFAQGDEGATMSGPVASSGNVIIEAGGASTADLHSDRYRAWDEFQASHPEIAQELSRRPQLIGDTRFVDNHQELKEFFDAHPDIRDDMEHNPGNYVALMPGAEARVHARHHRHHHHHAESASS